MSREANNVMMPVGQCIEMMKNGSSMLKCTKVGRRHFRAFRLSSDHERLSWTSPSKDASASSISLSAIKEIVEGQNTAIFKKNKLPEYEHISFSIVYGEKTLDIICKDVQEYTIWKQGLQHLIAAPVGSSPPPLLSASTEIKKMETLEISFKGKQTVVVKKENTTDIYTWGRGGSGRLGHQDEGDMMVPKIVEGLLGKDVCFVSCGFDHCGAVTSQGDLYTWGCGEFGKLGHGHDKDRGIPLTVSALRGRRVLSLSCGQFHTLILTDTGEVYASGRGEVTGVGVAGDVTVLTPRPIPELSSERIISVNAGKNSSAAVTEDGRLYMWGLNQKYQLGTGDDKSLSKPTQITFPSSSSSSPSLSSSSGSGGGGGGANVLIASVSCGAVHAIALSRTGQIYVWGEDTHGQLGLGNCQATVAPVHDRPSQPSPILMPMCPSHVVTISCGYHHNACLTSNGEAYTWGAGQDGQLGHGPDVTVRFLPTSLATKLAAKKVVNISCGISHTIAITDRAIVYTWGNGVGGALGHSSTFSLDNPTPIDSLIGKQVKAISAGGQFTAVTVLHGWVPDEESTTCMSCKIGFTPIRRRHHCRKCGGLFCGACSSKRIPILQAGLGSPVRVCEKCYAELISKKK